VDNSGVAEHHERQWQKVGDKVHENSHAFSDGLALVYAKFYAPAFHDIRRDNDDRSHKCWYNDPEKCDCSIHKTLFRTIKLQNAQDNNLLAKANYNSCSVWAKFLIVIMAYLRQANEIW